MQTNNNRKIHNQKNTADGPRTILIMNKIVGSKIKTKQKREENILFVPFVKKRITQKRNATSRKIKKKMKKKKWKRQVNTTNRKNLLC